MTTTRFHWLRRLVVLLAFNVGGWMVFDGMHAFLTGASSNGSGSRTALSG